MITQYIYSSIFIIAIVGGFYTIIIAFVSFHKMLGHLKPAPLFIKITGCAHIMRKYLTDEGIRLRNKAFTYVLIFTVFWGVAVSAGIQMDPDGWEKTKVEFEEWKSSLNQKPSSFPFK